MQVEWPAEAAAILRDWPEWFIEDGQVWTRIKASGSRTRGVWIKCERCERIAPAHHYNARRFCSLACRNSGMVGDRSGNWRGGRWVNPAGYVRIVPHGRQRIFEHRYVMEQMIGRALFSHESVHHINGQRDDNRPENLELWVSGHPVGIRATDALPHCATCTCANH